MPERGYIVSSVKNNTATQPSPLSLEDHFHHCVDMSPEDRRRYLETLFVQDPETAREVESLIQIHENTHKGFLDKPAPLPEWPTSHSSAAALSLFPDLTTHPVHVGKYTLVSSLGRGAMAEVFLGQATGAADFSKRFAIKCILPQYSTDAECLAQFENEARLSSQLSHANIVQTYDFLHVQDNYFLVMEYVHGKNLQSLLQMLRKSQKRLPFAYAAYIVNEICKGLDYAHRKEDDHTRAPLHLIHRDISPKNIMLAHDGSVKIVDFGIAKATTRLMQETNVGILKGTVKFMSPEQADGDTIDQRSDLFSAARILLELISDKPVFYNLSTVTTIKNVRRWESPVEEIESLEIPSTLKFILRRGLEANPGARFQTAEGFHRALQQFLSELSPSVSQKDIANLLKGILEKDRIVDKWPLETPPSRTRWGLLGVIFLGIFLGIMGLTHQMGWLKTEPPPVIVKRVPKRSLCTTEFLSVPSRAVIRVNGNVVGQTPVRVNVPCGKTIDVSASLGGDRFAKRQLVVNRSGTQISLTLTPPAKRTPASTKKRRK